MSGLFRSVYRRRSFDSPSEKQDLIWMLLVSVSVSRRGSCSGFAFGFRKVSEMTYARHEVWGSWQSGLGPAHTYVARSIPLPPHSSAKQILLDSVLSAWKQSPAPRKRNDLPKMAGRQNVGKCNMPAPCVCAQGAATYTVTL